MTSWNDTNASSLLAVSPNIIFLISSMVSLKKGEVLSLLSFGSCVVATPRVSSQMWRLVTDREVKAGEDTGLMSVPQHI